ncbi:unannotated protein [freshwater metagenome]|uniref:Unannotated protein n=1 Tax=freshwater metagenome TaxID=449393 RepID=A0A6J6R834_9ZZZZ
MSEGRTGWTYLVLEGNRSFFDCYQNGKRTEQLGDRGNWETPMGIPVACHHSRVANHGGRCMLSAP